jgi:hypothetical protein
MGFHYPVQKSRPDADWVQQVVDSGLQPVFDSIVQALADGYCSTGSCAKGTCKARIGNTTLTVVFENDALFILHVAFRASCSCA